ncbi:MAG: hypothetical protein AAFV85_20425 [Cyanobacteria bacterium J06634_6]
MADQSVIAALTLRLRSVAYGWAFCYLLPAVGWPIGCHWNVLPKGHHR